MSVLVPFGDFSRMTHLSVKALRFHHDPGLLEPARIDPSSGYRFYDPGQVPIAQVIRRFRDLDMPLDQVRAVLTAPDVETQDQGDHRALERDGDQAGRVADERVQPAGAARGARGPSGGRVPLDPGHTRTGRSGYGGRPA